MKSFKILLFLLLFSLPAFTQEIDYNKIKLVDEIFLAMEYVTAIDKEMRIYLSKPRRSNPYLAILERGRRKLVILLNHYEIRYKEDFNLFWNYETWLKTIPNY